MKDGQPHTARIIYEPPRLTVYLDDSIVRQGAVDLAAAVGGDGTAWVGFTSSTGGSFENHDILSWKFESGPRGKADSSAATVDSDIAVVDSSVSFAPAPCLPERKLCTPEQAVVQNKGGGIYHVYLPANREWGASVPDREALPARVLNVKGTVCWGTAVADAPGLQRSGWKWGGAGE
ncbi:MAG TPA: hypothetical protein VN736_00070 [Candidatus Limnocylindrales bacterium]|nr:hypothetical protein [Candidatus Limnocylindrales bacterium]